MNFNLTPEKEEIAFENVWKRSDPAVNAEVMGVWKQFGNMDETQLNERLDQLVFVLRNRSGQVIGVSTAFKAYIRQLQNYLYAMRCMIVPGFRIPGLTSKLFVMTRDFLESIHESDGPERMIGVITVVENNRFRAYRNEAVWPASKMVYIGNTKGGNPIRVYYFKGARIS